TRCKCDWSSDVCSSDLFLCSQLTYLHTLKAPTLIHTPPPTHTHTHTHTHTPLSQLQSYSHSHTHNTRLSYIHSLSPRRSSHLPSPHSKHPPPHTPPPLHTHTHTLKHRPAFHNYNPIDM